MEAVDEWAAGQDPAVGRSELPAGTSDPRRWVTHDVGLVEDDPEPLRTLAYCRMRSLSLQKCSKREKGAHGA